MSVEQRVLSKVFLLVQVLILALVPPARAKDFFGIVDYKPSTFVEQPTAPFFYSVGNRLRFGSVIEEKGPILFEAKPSDGGIWAVYVSPDETKAVVASGGNLYFALPGQSPVLLLREAYDVLTGRGAAEGPIGKPVYDYRPLQWDASSRFIYIPRGARLDSRYPSHSALLRIEAANPINVVEITDDMKAHGTFFVGSEAICFQRVVNRGDLIWKCVIGGVERSPKVIEEHRIVMDDGTSVEGRPFASFRWSRGGIWLTEAGFAIRAYNGRWGFFSKDSDEAIFQFNGGMEPLKGHYVDGIYEVNANVLPGGRYAFLDLLIENFKGRRGQILVDGLTGQYREVPRGTLVYRNLNSRNYDRVKFGLRWSDSPEFEPMFPLRPYRQ
jgi:hypothetical protein